MLESGDHIDIYGLYGYQKVITVVVAIVIGLAWPVLVKACRALNRPSPNKPEGRNKPDPLRIF